MNIAFIRPPLEGHLLRGTGTYTDELYKALRKLNKVNVSLVDINSDHSKFDIIHYPYFDPFFLTLPIIKTKPTIVTVHDLIPLKFSQHFPRGLRGEIKWLIQRYSLKDASAVVTDSIASKNDIVEFTGIKWDKIHVVYLGVREEIKRVDSIKFLHEVKQKYNLPDNFILHVGDVNYNKNIPNIVRAFSEILKLYPNLSLVLIGNGLINDSPQLFKILQLISQLSLENKVLRLGYIDLSDLVGIYNLAKVYLQPSFAEGFGLPVLEAMACGCPTIVSNTSSLPELVGDAGLLVEPNNYLDIAKSIVTLISSLEMRQEFIKKGLNRVKNFTWEKCVQETIKVYKQVFPDIY